jgi:hypothetical protein
VERVGLWVGSERVSRGPWRARSSSLLGALLAVAAGAAPMAGCSPPHDDDDRGVVDAGPDDAPDVVARRVLALVFDPMVDGRRLSTELGFHSPEALLASIPPWWSTTTAERVRFEIVETSVVDAFPVKVDGFVYDGDEYRRTLAGQSAPHQPDGADVAAILAAYDVCGRVDAGDIDELWMMGGPYFGFYESQLAGAAAFEYNSPPLRGTACRRLVPVMGFNYERALPEAIHDFGHRAEATLTHLFGRWSQDSTANDWERFGLVAALSPTVGFSGCGSIHYPPTATSDYDYTNRRTVPSLCDDFAHYPDLAPDPASAVVDMTCSAWGCDELGFYAWWFQHLPALAGLDDDGRPRDWLRAVVDPQWMLDQTPALLPCGVATDAATCAALPVSGEARCQWASCTSTCVAADLVLDDGACACLAATSTPSCDATAGCAWYACSERCLPTGTSNDTACR